MQRGVSITCVLAVLLGTIYPTFAAKKPAAAVLPVAPAILHGRVVHGAHGIGARVWINPDKKKGPLAKPKVSARGVFDAKLKPGTYVIHARHAGVGQGRVVLHLAPGQQFDVIVPLIKPRRFVRFRQIHHFGCRHVVVKPVAPKILGAQRL